MQNEKLDTILQKLKHMRGRHDQRTHNRWPSGYIAQTSSGISASTLSETKRNLLQKKRLSNTGSLILANSNQNYRDFLRIPKNVDTSSIPGEQVGNSSIVWKFSYNGLPYFKREEPNFSASHIFPISAHLIPVMADIISTGMGVNVAPVAQLMDDGKVVTAGLNVVPESDPRFDMRYMFEMEPGDRDGLSELEDSFEAIALLDTLVGQTDGHAYNYVSLSDGLTDEGLPTLGGIDFDLAGGSMPVNSRALSRYLSLRCDMKYKRYRVRNDGYVIRSSGIALLKKLKNNIQWTGDFNQETRDILMARIDALIDFGENFDSMKFTDSEMVKQILDKRLQQATEEAKRKNNADNILNAINELHDDYNNSINVSNQIDLILGKSYTAAAWMDAHNGKKYQKSFSHLKAIDSMINSYFNGIFASMSGKSIAKYFVSIPLKKIYFKFANELSKASTNEEIEKIKSEYEKEKKRIFNNINVQDDFAEHAEGLTNFLTSLSTFVMENADLIENYDEEIKKLNPQYYEIYKKTVYPYINLLNQLTQAYESSDQATQIKIMNKIYEYTKTVGNKRLSNPARKNFLLFDEDAWRYAASPNS